jgi:hypothetical protein
VTRAPSAVTGYVLAPSAWNRDAEYTVTTADCTCTATRRTAATTSTRPTEHERQHVRAGATLVRAGRAPGDMTRAADAAARDEAVKK